jgi:polar amino acid transport system substrate-binding protein
MLARLFAVLGFSAAVLGTILGPGAAHAQGGALERIAEAGVIRVAVPQDFPPFGSVGPDMRPVGYDIDTAALVADRLGVRLELTPVASTNRIPYLTTGRVDLVISSLGKNAEREQVVDFSSAYAPFFNGVFGPEETAVADAGGLDGRTVGVTRGSIEDIELTAIAPAGAVLKRYEDNNGTISAFLSGQVELIATGNVVAAAILDRNPPKEPRMKFLIKNSPCYIAVDEGEAGLLARVDEIIAQAKSDGSLDAIARKWLKAGLPADL